jgi:hypothetical protein
MSRIAFLGLLLCSCARHSEFERRFDDASADLPPAVLHREGEGAAMGGNVRGARDHVPPPRRRKLAEVTRVVEDQLPAVKRCYERAVQSGSAASGKAIVNLSIAASGKVSEVRVDAPDFQNSELPSCVSSAARRWTFPPAQEARSVSYPFVFMAG